MYKEFRLNQLANGLEFLGEVMMSRNGNRDGDNGLSGHAAEQLGNLLMSLADYVMMIDEETRE